MRLWLVGYWTRVFALQIWPLHLSHHKVQGESLLLTTYSSDSCMSSVISELCYLHVSQRKLFSEHLFSWVALSFLPSDRPLKFYSSRHRAQRRHLQNQQWGGCSLYRFTFSATSCEHQNTVIPQAKPTLLYTSGHADKITSQIFHTSCSVSFHCYKRNSVTWPPCGNSYSTNREGVTYF